MDIHRLHLADVTFPAQHPRAGESAPVDGFLVRHPSGVLLFDTGLGPPHPDIDKWYKPVRFSLDAALAEAGATRDDVTMIANSHLHFDHCGGNEQFPGVPILVQAEEYRAAKAKYYTIPEFVDFSGANYELIDGERVILPGIRLLPTPGHTPGHQSAVLSTPEGLVVLAGQAAETADDVKSLAALLLLNPVRILLAHDSREWTAGY